jgi:hypothetical protein
MAFIGDSFPNRNHIKLADRAWSEKLGFPMTTAIGEASVFSSPSDLQSPTEDVPDPHLHLSSLRRPIFGL